MTAHGDDHRIGINPYLDWARAEGIPINYGVSLNLFEIELGDWPRYGVAGGIAHYPGSGDYCNQFVMAIPPGGSTTPQRHLYEEIYFVLDGRGSTQVEFADGQRRSFEWGPRSAFAVPLNAKYRHFNASGTQRALLVTTTTLPILMQLFRDSDFIFNTEHHFTNRIGRDEYYSGEGDLTLIRPGNNVWETNFIPDMNAIELTPWDDRGQDSGNIMFTLANSGMHLHVSEIAPATYKKAHRHPAGAHVLTLTGSGYSLLWSEGDADFQRVDWEYGVVFPPIEDQYHQHFVTSNNPSRYLATMIGGVRYPFPAEQRRLILGSPGQKQAASRSVKEGGNQIEYEDQDPRIHALWLDEMKRAGIEPKLKTRLKT